MFCGLRLEKHKFPFSINNIQFSLFNADGLCLEADGLCLELCVKRGCETRAVFLYDFFERFCEICDEIGVASLLSTDGSPEMTVRI